MRWLLVLLLPLLLFPDDATSRRGKRVIVVRDYTRAAWDGVIAQTVVDFNAAMPRGGPRLVYKRAHGACPRFAPKHAIVYCSVEFIPSPGPGFPDPAGIVYNRRTIHLADTYVRGDGAVHRQNHACHELMHVLTGAPDMTRSEDIDSCLWGFQPAPGATDIALLRDAYQRKRR